MKREVRVMSNLGGMIMQTKVTVVVENEKDKRTESGRDEREIVELGVVSEDTEGFGIHYYDGGIALQL